MVEGTGKEFMERTKYENMSSSDQSRGLPQPPLELPYDKTRTVVDLPKPPEVSIGDVSLRRAIEDRRSVREYSDAPLTLEELSWLLWCTQGVREVAGRNATLRNVPSAGARHALETYILVNRVDGLKPGIYRFLATDHKLVEVEIGESMAERVSAACLGQRFVMASAATFIWTAVPYRMAWRYGERGYRYMHVDVGHVCQNLYLAAEAIGSGACAIGAFNDDQLNELLNIDGEEHFTIYVATVGKKR